TCCATAWCRPPQRIPSSTRSPARPVPTWRTTRATAASPPATSARCRSAAMPRQRWRSAALGIVYATDAKAEQNVKAVGVFPADSHPPIVYPAALTVNAKPDAAQYLAFLQSRAAKGVFDADVFAVLPRQTSCVPPRLDCPRRRAMQSSMSRLSACKLPRAVSTRCSAFAEHDRGPVQAMLDLSPDEWIAIRLSLKIAVVATAVALPF